MFKFPFKWLQEESDIEISYDSLLEWLDLQGFEIASIEDIDGDKVVEIEVKANRPDMLSVAGVMREAYISKKVPAPKKFDADMKLDYIADDVLSHKIVVKSPDVHRYYGVEINGVDNTVKTPDYIVSALKKLGVADINPIVDISNYVLLRIGQPNHVFDSDKVEGDITIENIPETLKYTTLSGSETELPKGSLLISDDKAPLCLAGIIGGKKAEIDENTKNIIIESASFDHIIIRTTSKKTHISTMASYRYERGVDTELSELGARMMAKMITDICGGTVKVKAFCHKDTEYSAHVLPLTVKRTNSVLGSKLSIDEIAAMLEQCYFTVEKLDDENMKVTVPSFRLDIDLDVDLIEEVGRIYGYHNIEPQPITLYAPYKENPINKNANILRNIMVGHGFIETLTYGFIPADTMDVLKLSADCPYYGDIHILNPLSNFYELMRPTMAYNMISTAINNMAVGKNDIKIFEIGKTFHRVPGHANSYDDYTEQNVFSALLCGTKVAKGFGVNKEVKFSVYDAIAIVTSIFDEYNIPFSVKNTDSVGFFEKGIGAEIFIGNKSVGIVGKVSKSVLADFENGKLAKDDMLYIEFCFEGMEESKKRIAFESEFPSIVREYNFVVKNGIHFSDYKSTITDESPFVVNASPIDVYLGKGVASGTSAVLISVEFNAINRTLTAEEIEVIENGFKAKLNDKYGIILKLM